MNMTRIQIISTSDVIRIKVISTSNVTRIRVNGSMLTNLHIRVIKGYLYLNAWNVTSN